MIRQICSSMAVAVAFAAVTGCGALPANVDAMSAVDPVDPGLPVLTLRWKYDVAPSGTEPKPQEFSSAAVYGDRVYVGSQKGVFYSLNQAGEVIWKRKLGSVSSRPLVAKDRVYIGTDDGFVIALAAKTGKELWRYATRGPILETPVVQGDVLFLSNESDHVYALDADTGKFRWHYRSETPEAYTLRGHSGVAVSDGLVLTGFSNGTMVALRTGTGSVAWLTSLKGEGTRFVDIDSTPVVSANTAYVSSSGGGIYALDKTTGLVRWRLPIKNAGGLTVDGNRLFAAAATTGVMALDLTGNIVWRQGTRGGGEPAAPVVSGEYLLYTLSEKGVYICDKRTGKLHQYFNPGDGISSPPTFWGNHMYVLGNGGTLYAMGVSRF